MSETLVKCLREKGRSVHAFIDAQGKRDWDLPQGGRAGAWKGPVSGDLKPHHNGLHLAKKDYLIDWLTGHHYVAETRGETVEGMDCVVAREARLTERLPVDNPKLRQFCENWLTMVPDILDALAVYPKLSQDARACVDVIQDKGIVKANETLESLKEFKYVRQSAMRLSYDELHSIEYNHCTTAAKTSLNSIVGVFKMAQKRSSTIEIVKVVSNSIARGLEALHGNLLFMRDLNEQGYDHLAEVESMNRFLKAKDLDNRPPARFFAEVRKKQNTQVLPALGF